MTEDIENTLKIKNGQAVSLSKIPVLEYQEFYALVLDLLQTEDVHCVNYYAFPHNDNLRFICCLADDRTQDIYLLSHIMTTGRGLLKLESLTKYIGALHIFEREIWENTEIAYISTLFIDGSALCCFAKNYTTLDPSTFCFYRLHHSVWAFMGD